MVVLSVLMFPAMVVRHNMGFLEMLLIDVPLFLGATTSICSFYAFSQRQAFGPHGWRKRLRFLPGVLALGIGLSVGNTRAVMEGLLGKASDFVRTPKLGVRSAADEWRGKRYREGIHGITSVEIGLAVYFGAMAAYAVSQGLWGSLPFILIFLLGYLYTSVLTVVQEIQPRETRTAQA